MLYAYEMIGRDTFSPTGQMFPSAEQAMEHAMSAQYPGYIADDDGYIIVQFNTTTFKIN